MVATRATKGNPATSKAVQAKASKASKGKDKVTEVAPLTLEEQMADAPAWAKALVAAMGESMLLESLWKRLMAVLEI